MSDYATHPFDFHRLFTLQKLWQWVLSCAKAFTYVVLLRNAAPVIAIILEKKTWLLEACHFFLSFCCCYLCRCGVWTKACMDPFLYIEYMKTSGWNSSVEPQSDYLAILLLSSKRSHYFGFLVVKLVSFFFFLWLNLWLMFYRKLTNNAFKVNNIAYTWALISEW